MLTRAWTAAAALQQRFWNRTPPEPLRLRDFAKKVQFYGVHHFWYGDVRWTYETRDDPPKEVGYIQFAPDSGQIGLFFLDTPFQNRGLGKQMLAEATANIHEAQLLLPAEDRTHKVWAVTTDNHPFWSNVWGSVFRPVNPASPRVTGSGYSADLDRVLHISKETA